MLAHVAHWDSRLTAQQNKAVELALNGADIHEIAEELDVDRVHASVCLSSARKRGVAVPFRTPRPRGPYPGAALFAMRAQGLSYAQIAERTGMSVANVRVRLSQHRRRLGIPPKSPGASRAAVASHWYALHQAGASFSVIARRYGVTRASVAGAVYRYRRSLP